MSMLGLLAIMAMASTDPSLGEAAVALRAGRLEQARTMIAAAVQRRDDPVAVDRLLADLAFAEARWEEASARYAPILRSGKVANGALLEQAGIAALQRNALDEASSLLHRATDAPGATWRAWSARGVTADQQGRWQDADEAYAQGLKLSPRSAQLLNNRGWSLIMRRRWQEALPLLAEATALNPGDPRIAANHDLAKAMAAGALPSRRVGEDAASYAARLNDAGVLVLATGDRRLAVSAFAQALEASDHWFARAANNLTLAEKSADQR